MRFDTAYRLPDGLRRLLAPLLVLALILPSLVSVIPASAAASLERDIAASLCSGETGGGSPVEPFHAEHDDCCILCPAGLGNAALSAEESGVPGPVQRVVRLEFAPSLFRIPGLHIAGPSARGPPSA